MILTVTLNPAVDQTLYVAGLKPHDTNRVTQIETDAGGKGINLSRVAAELGAATVATGFLAGDAGELVRRVLRDQGVVDACLEAEHPTRTVWSVESGDGPPTTFNAAGEPVSSRLLDQLCGHVAALAKSADWVALGGSLPKGVPADVYVRLGQIARDAGAKVLIDADGEPMRHALDFGPDLIKPNASEAARLLGRELNSATEVLKAAQELRERLDGPSRNPTVIVSMGGDGAALAWSGGSCHFAAFPVTAKSTIGSGDSMLAGYLIGLLRGLTPEQAMPLALAAGAATAESDGAGIARKSEVERLVLLNCTETTA